MHDRSQKILMNRFTLISSNSYKLLRRNKALLFASIFDYAHFWVRKKLKTFFGKKT